MTADVLASDPELVIAEPGLYTISDAAYHADPVPGGSLSSTGARHLITSCPAMFNHEQNNPEKPKKAFDLGRAAHQEVLGEGGGVVTVNATDWRTKAAQEARDAAYAEGLTPLLAADVEVIHAMAAAIRSHELASALLNPDHGTPEQSGFWIDPETGVWRRLRVDWFPDRRSGRTIVPDYKTSISADPREFAKAAANFGYHQQADWYLDGLKTLRGDPDMAFVFIVQEKTAPYLVSVVQLDANAMEAGRRLNRRALSIYADCTQTGVWPGYTSGVEVVGLPRWYLNRIEGDQ